MIAKVDYNLTDIYKLYTQEVPKSIQLTKEQFTKINTLFVQKALNKILEDAESVKFPILGKFKVRKFKQDYTRRLYLDHKKTKEAGMKIYHLNEDRDGHIYKYQWHKSKMHQNIDLYSWIPAKYTVRRKLPKFLKENPQKDFFL